MQWHRSTTKVESEILKFHRVVVFFFLNNLIDRGDYFEKLILYVKE
jgi:hypothetical protein